MSQGKPRAISEGLAALFWERVELPDNPDDCWGWTGWESDAGAAGLTVQAAVSETRRSYSVSAHMVSYRIHIGEIPQHQNVRRTCKNKQCTNPKHLELRPWGAKRIDKYAKGRGKREPGMSGLESDLPRIDPFGKPRRAHSTALQRVVRESDEDSERC